MNAPFSTPDLRTKLEAAIERLLAVLDAIDADPDLEPTTSASAFLDMPSGALDECEDEGLDEDDGTGEPSLGSMENYHWLFTWGTERGSVGDQRNWAGGGAEDLEEDHDGSEPSLGATHSNDQARAWSRYDAGDDREHEHDGREPDTDREHDPAELGIADFEGANEQGFLGARHGFQHVE